MSAAFSETSAANPPSLYEVQHRRNHGRRFFTRKGARWEITVPVLNLLDLLTQ